MRRLRDPLAFGEPRIPVAFKVWFAFVACLIACIWIVAGYVIYSVLAAGPNGVGHAIGGFVKAVRESAQ